MPLSIWWGPEFLQIYNDSCIPVLGELHPHALGQPAAESWSAAWGILEPAIERFAHREVESVEALVPRPMVGAESIDWWYQALSLSPIRDPESEAVRGLLCAYRDSSRLPRTATEQGLDVAEAPPSLSELPGLGDGLPDLATDGSDGRQEPAARILIVETEELLPFGLANLFRSAGWSVSTSPAGPGTPVAARDQDAIICGIGSDSAGLELVKAIRDDPEVGMTPIVLIASPGEGADLAVQALEAGADDVVSQPFDPSELVARVSRHMEAVRACQDMVEDAELRSSNLHVALTSSRVIGPALGIIMATQRVTSEEAFLRLRSVSQETNRKLRDVADEVVLTGVLPGWTQ